MDPKELQSFERRPAFGIYPPGEQDPFDIPVHIPDGASEAERKKLERDGEERRRIREIRDKWARLGVDLAMVWRVIRKGYDLYAEQFVIDPRHPNQLTPRRVARDNYSWQFPFKLSSYMKTLVRMIRNDKRTKDQKESDRNILIAQCGEYAVDAFEGFCEQVIREGPPLSHTVVEVREKGSGKHSKVVGEASYFIAELLKKAGLSWTVKIPKEKRFSWKDIFDLLSYYYLLDDHLKPRNIHSYYHYHRKNGVSAYWPTPAKMGISPKSPSKR